MQISSMMKHLAVASVLSVAVLSAGKANAQLTITGTSTATIAGAPQLTFAGTGFSGVTSGGFLGFSNLGTFNLVGTPTGAVSGTVTLNLAFTSPIAGASFPATVTGNVSTGAGGVFIDFANTGTLVTFTNPAPGGSFVFTLDDVSVQTGVASTLTGRVTNANVIPEPGTLALVAMGGLGALGMVARRRKMAA